MNEQTREITETIDIHTWDWLNDRAKFSKITIGKMIDTVVIEVKAQLNQRVEEARRAEARERLPERLQKIEAFIEGLKSL